MSIVISKIKELEFIFRRILIEGNLGILQNSNILLYEKDELPLSKITNICNKIIQNTSLAQMTDSSLFQDLLEASRVAAKFVRLTRTRSENADLEEMNRDDEKSDLMNQEQPIENEEESESAGTDNENEDRIEENVLE